MTAEPSIETIARVFAEYFEPWRIRLTKRTLERRSRGHIQRAGWLIQYCFGKDERGEFLDFYASHRMTNDRHVRIREDGSMELLPIISTWSRWSNDPVELKKIREELTARNREVERMLIAKGFTLQTLNMAIGTGRAGVEEDE